MDKRYIGIMGAIAIVAALFFANTGNNGKSGSLKPEPSQSTAPGIVPSILEKPQEKNYHEVSIPALSEKPLAGSDFMLGKVLADTPQYTRHYITYQSGSLKITGIMNMPKGKPPEGGYPLIVLNHGYIDPAIYTNGRGLRREQDYLAKQGFAILHIDYRGHAQSDKDPESEINIRTGYIEDALNAVDAVKKSDLSSVNKNKVGMLGHSMGGGVTLGAITSKPDLVQAAVLFAPVSSNASDNYYRWTERRADIAEKIRATYGAPDKNVEFWANVSPRNFFSRVSTPVQIHHGTADADVPVEWSRETEHTLKQAGKNVTLYIYEGQPHEFTTKWDEVMRTTADFFRRQLSQ